MTGSYWNKPPVANRLYRGLVVRQCQDFVNGPEVEAHSASVAL
jgi:hypothetical protein